MNEDTIANNGYLNACCTMTSKQLAQVHLPVKIEPKVSLGCPTMQCIGQPATQCVCKDSGLDITITQCVAICLPVEYSLSTKTGDADISYEDCCCE